MGVKSFIKTLFSPEKVQVLDVEPHKNYDGLEEIPNTTNSLDDKELIAVITAAIYAYMGSDVPKDGFVVRSIRKVTTNKI